MMTTRLTNEKTTGPERSKTLLLKGPHVWTYPAQGPARRQPTAPRLNMKETRQLILEQRPEGQAPDLTCTSRSLWEYFLGTQN